MTWSRQFAGILLRDLFAFTFLYSLTSTGVFLLSSSPSLSLASLGLLIPFALLALARQKAKSVLLFVGAHIILLIFPFFLPVPVYLRAVYFVFILIASIYSVNFRLRGGYDVTLVLAVAGVCVNSVICLLLEHFQRFGMTGILFGGACVMLFCYLSTAQMDSVDSLMDMLLNKAGQPLLTIRRANNAALAGFLSLIALFASIALFRPLGQFLQKLVIYLLSFLRLLVTALFSLFRSDSASPPLEETPMQQQSAPPDFLHQEPATPSRLLELLGTLLYYLAITAMAVGILVLVVYGAYRFYQRFAATYPSDGDLREALVREPVRERVAAAFRQLRIRSLFAGRGEREYICRAYYRSVRRYMRRGVAVSACDTTGEIEQKAPLDEEFSALTRRYESVRYGPEHPPGN